jgi:hypothetical protein
MKARGPVDTKPEKAPKKVKEKGRTPQERLEHMQYNHLMYGRTRTEMKLVPKPVDYGASYLKHPKFQALMTAFRKGTAFSFEVKANGAATTIATDESQITFGGKELFYSRPLNRYEENLFLNRTNAVRLQESDPAVHLVFAVLRSFPELEHHGLLFLYHKFYQGNESLDSSPTGEGTNLLIGPFQHSKVTERPRS